MNDLKLVSSLRIERSRLQRHWDKKLSSCITNPYPLAPRDLVRQGLVDGDNYSSENHNFSSFCDSIMNNEISSTHRPVVACPQIKILGLGISRGLGWIEQAIGLGFYIKAYDISDVACETFSCLVEGFTGGHRIEVVPGEIESELRLANMNECDAFVYYLSQFIQVQKVTKMRRILRRLGALIRGASGVGRSVYLVHPFGLDNSTPRLWAGKEHSVEWGDTIPYSKDEILTAIGRDCVLEVLGSHMYYHQQYSLVRIRTKG